MKLPHPDESELALPCGCRTRIEGDEIGVYPCCPGHARELAAAADRVFAAAGIEVLHLE